MTAALLNAMITSLRPQADVQPADARQPGIAPGLAGGQPADFIELISNFSKENPSLKQAQLMRAEAKPEADMLVTPNDILMGTTGNLLPMLPSMGPNLAGVASLYTPQPEPALGQSQAVDSGEDAAWATLGLRNSNLFKLLANTSTPSRSIAADALVSGALSPSGADSEVLQEGLEIISPAPAEVKLVKSEGSNSYLLPWVLQNAGRDQGASAQWHEQNMVVQLGNGDSIMTSAQQGSHHNTLVEPRGNAGIFTPISVPVQHPRWGEELASRMTWMIKGEIKAAEIKLNPPHLGPVEVKIMVSDDQVQVHFTSQHAAVREAIEMSMPRLRDMLGEQGLNLVNVDISNQSFSRHGGHPAFGDQNTAVAAAEDALANSHDVLEQGQGLHTLSVNLIDYYA